MKVKVTALKTSSVRNYSYETFREDYRFFLASGKEYKEDEEIFENVMEILETELDPYLTTVSVIRNGLKIEFIPDVYMV